MRTYIPIQPPALQRGLPDSDYRYREFLPSKELEAYVACYWTVDVRATEYNRFLHRVIPDGCVDIIIDMKSPSFAKGAFVAGLMTGFEVIELSTSQSLFGIRFFIDSVSRFIRYPASELIGNHVFLEELWGREAEFFVEEARAAAGISEIIERVEVKLLQSIIHNKSRSNALLQTSLQHMYASQGMISIRDLAEKQSYSERNIRRTFQKELGVGPKELLDIIRFQSLLRERSKETQSSFTDIAVKFGYYDQPHFIHHFKRYYGLAPNQVFK
jgi:AraC-like DNA-binding protein